MNRNIKRNKQQLEQVVDAVLKKMQLFQGDDAFLKNDFEEYCTPHMIDCLSKVWILQKLKVLKEIAIMCEDQSMQAAIDKIPLKIHDIPLSAIVDLFLTAVPVVNVSDTPTRVLANWRGFSRHGRTPQRAITSPLHPVTSLPLSRLFCGCLF